MSGYQKLVRIVYVDDKVEVYLKTPANPEKLIYSSKDKQDLSNSIAEKISNAIISIQHKSASKEKGDDNES